MLGNPKRLKKALFLTKLVFRCDSCLLIKETNHLRVCDEHIQDLEDRGIEVPEDRRIYFGDEKGEVEQELGDMIEE